MTNEEAIKDIKECIKPVVGGISLDMAIEALEKQIPKKPIFEGDGYYNGELVYDTWICPNCGKGYELDYDDYDFCPRCGQMISRLE